MIMQLVELFKEQEKFHIQQVNIPFEEKIKVLVELRKLAYSWGGKKMCSSGSYKRTPFFRIKDEIKIY